MVGASRSLAQSAAGLLSAGHCDALQVLVDPVWGVEREARMRVLMRAGMSRAAGLDGRAGGCEWWRWVSCNGGLV